VGENVPQIKTESLIAASDDTGLEVKAEKTKYVAHISSPLQDRIIIKDG
jgi:hypothetical protein